MEWIFWLVALLVVAALVFKGASNNQAKEAPALYEQQKALLTPAERSFYGVVLQAVDSQTVVFSKVRVADVLKPIQGLDRSQWQTTFNKISAKHFDFVLCDSKTLAVKMVIELDDSSHQKKARVNRDVFLDSACKSAKLDLKRIKAQRAYRIDEVRVQLFGASKSEIVDQEKIIPKVTEPLVVIQVDSNTKQANSVFDLHMSPEGFAKAGVELEAATQRTPQVFVHVGTEGYLINQVLMIGEAKNGAFNRWMQATNGHKNAFFWSIGEADTYTQNNAGEYSNYLLYFAALSNQQTKLVAIDVTQENMSAKKRELIKEYNPIWDQYRNTLKHSKQYPTLTGQNKDHAIVDAVSKLGAAWRLIFAQRKHGDSTVHKLPDVISLKLRSAKQWR